MFIQSCNPTVEQKGHPLWINSQRCKNHTIICRNHCKLIDIMSNDSTTCAYNVMGNFMHHLIKVSVQLFRIWKWLWPSFLCNDEALIICVQVLQSTSSIYTVT